MRLCTTASEPRSAPVGFSPYVTDKVRSDRSTARNVEHDPHVARQLDVRDERESGTSGRQLERCPIEIPARLHATMQTSTTLTAGRCRGICELLKQPARGDQRCVELVAPAVRRVHAGLAIQVV
jgi:hypothetical protein